MSGVGRPVSHQPMSAAGPVTTAALVDRVAAEDPHPVDVERTHLEPPGRVESLGHRVEQVDRRRPRSSRTSCSPRRGRRGGSRARGAASRGTPRHGSPVRPVCARSGSPTGRRGSRRSPGSASSYRPAGGRGARPGGPVARSAMSRVPLLVGVVHRVRAVVRVVGHDAVEGPRHALGVEREVGDHVGAGPVGQERRVAPVVAVEAVDGADDGGTTHRRAVATASSRSVRLHALHPTPPLAGRTPAGRSARRVRSALA